MSLNVANGQLATSNATPLATATQTDLWSLRLHNGSNSVAQVVNIYVMRGTGGTLRLLFTINIPVNGAAVIAPIPVESGDTLNASTTTATNTNYDITGSGATVGTVPPDATTNPTLIHVWDGSGNLMNSATVGAAITATSVAVTAVLTSSGPTGAGIGYATGAGGAVSQATGRTTGVTLSKLTGAITLFSAAGSATPATFTVTNTTVAATDTIIVVQKSGTDAYSATVSAVGAGSFALTIVDLTGTTAEAPVFNFAVLKGVAA